MGTVQPLEQSACGEAVLKIPHEIPKKKIENNIQLDD
jgi:hypothetical protein